MPTPVQRFLASFADMYRCCSRRWRGVAIALSAVVVSAVVTACTNQQAHGGAGVSHPSAPAPSAEVIGSQYRYIWTARQGPFLPADLQRLGTGFHTVIIEKTHDHGNFDAQDAEARTLAAQPGHPAVFVNFLSRIITKPFLSAAGPTFNQAWILRDSSGRPIPFKESKSPDKGWWVDVSNPDYRHFIEQWIARRLQAAPYAGVMFDNFHVAADDNIGATLPPGKAEQLDAGLQALLTETRAAIGPAKLIYFNGVARSTASGKNVRTDRQFGYVPEANGVQDEFFCYQDMANTFRPAADLWADIQTYHQLALSGKAVLHSVKIRTDDAKGLADQVKRFCFATFLMDYVPGQSMIQFKSYADEDKGPQIEDSAAPEQDIPLGHPTADAVARGDVWSRTFAHGWVVVNAGEAPAQINAPSDLTLRNGNATGQHLSKGASYTVPPHDGAYFISG